MRQEWSHTPPVSPEEDLPIHHRLRAVYRFALQKIFFDRGMKKSARHLDVGTYEGTFVGELFSFADQVVSFDLDSERLLKAKQRPDLQQFAPNSNVSNIPGRLSLAQMNALHIGLPSQTFDSATIIEVFGAGFTGEKEKIEEVIREVHRTLKPGGVLVMTMKSASSENALSAGAIGQLDKKGLPISRKVLKPLLLELFGSNYDWYGQVVMKKNAKGPIRNLLERTSQTTQSMLERQRRVGKSGVIFQALSRLDEWIFFPVRKPFYGMELPFSVLLDENRVGQSLWDPRAFIPRKVRNLDKEMPIYWVFVGQKPANSVNLPTK